MNNAIEEIVYLRSVASAEARDEMVIKFTVETSHLSHSTISSLVDLGCIDDKIMLSDKEVDTTNLHISHPDCRVTITIRPPSNIADCCVFSDQWDMILKLSWWGRTFTAYYLWEERVVIAGSDAKGTATQAIAILKICEILKCICDFDEVVDGTKSLIFLNSSRIDIPLQIEKRQFGLCNPTEQLLNMVSQSTIGHEMSRAIVKNNLSHFLSLTDKSLRLTKLVLRFNEFQEKCISELRIYNSTDKYQGMSADIRDKLLSFEKTIHSILADIYLKLFSLPVALVAAIFKTESMTIRDKVLFLLAITFAFALVVYMTRSQRHLLDYTRSCISDAKKDIAMKYGLSVNELSSRFDKIENWSTRINYWLIATELIAYAALILAFIVMFNS